MTRSKQHRPLWAGLAVALAVAPACAVKQPDAAPAGPETVKGVTWEWIGTTTPAERIEVTRPSRYTIRLKDNGEAQIRYDCNHGGGLYEMAGTALSFGPLIATRTPCGDDSQDFAYRQQLQVVDSYYTEGGELFFELQGEGATMRFRRANGG